MNATIARIIAALSLAGLLVLPSAAQTVTLRLASYVPANSPWELGLRKLAADFDRISSGKVRLTFPQSVKNSTQSDIIQKMKLGVDGALFDTTGLALVYPGILALSMPSLIRTDAEFDAVLKAVMPILKDKLSERYVVLGVAKAGWVRFFSATPIVYPEDLSNLRMSTSVTEDRVSRLLQSVGTKTIKGETSEMLLQINSKSVDSFYYSPIFVVGLWPQIQGKIAYMSPFKVCPFVGAILFTKESWAKVPAELQPKLEEAVRTVAEDMGRDTDKLESESIASLVKAGLKIPAYPADADARWNALYFGKPNTLMSEMFAKDKDLLDSIAAALATLRKGK